MPVLTQQDSTLIVLKIHSTVNKRKGRKLYPFIRETMPNLGR